MRVIFEGTRRELEELGLIPKEVRHPEEDSPELTALLHTLREMFPHYILQKEVRHALEKGDQRLLSVVNPFKDSQRWTSNALGRLFEKIEGHQSGGLVLERIANLRSFKRWAVREVK